MLQSPQFLKGVTSKRRRSVLQLKRVIIPVVLTGVLIFASVIGKKGISIADVSQLIVNVITTVE